MTAFTTIPDADIDSESPVTVALMTALRDNPKAIAEGDATAPSIAGAAIAADGGLPGGALVNGSVTQAKLSSSSVGTSQLKVSSGAVSNNTSYGAAVTLPGGYYGFYPNTRSSNASSSRYVGATMSPIGADGTAVYNNLSTSYAAFIMLGNSSGYAIYANQVYVTGSPPYDLGDGEIGQFVFALVDNATGKIEAVYAAPEAPWHNNGPTNIHADYYDKKGVAYQIVTPKTGKWSVDAAGNPTMVVTPGKTQMVKVTQALKQADMALIPHPFIATDLRGKTVVMLDPVADLTWYLAESHEQGLSPNELLHDDYLRIGNTPLVRSGPPGVAVVDSKWRLT